MHLLQVMLATSGPVGFIPCFFPTQLVHSTAGISFSFCADVCIVAASRTPIGGFQGSLTSFTAPQLGSLVLKGEQLFVRPTLQSAYTCEAVAVMVIYVGDLLYADVMQRSGVEGSLVEEVFMGNVLSAGLGQVCDRLEVQKYAIIAVAREKRAPGRT